MATVMVWLIIQSALNIRRTLKVRNSNLRTKMQESETTSELITWTSRETVNTIYLMDKTELALTKSSHNSSTKDISTGFMNIIRVKESRYLRAPTPLDPIFSIERIIEWLIDHLFTQVLIQNWILLAWLLSHDFYTVFLIVHYSFISHDNF